MILWRPSRINFLTTHPVLALPCCTETEPDFEDFLALEPSSGLGCGYVGLIVSSWSTLTRENCAAAAGGAVWAEKATGRLVGGRTGAGVCALLGWVLKGAQIGLGDFATFWRRGLAVGSLVQLCWSR